MPNVLTPGAGGAAAIGAIKSLRLSGFAGRIVATDTDRLAAGLYLADKGYLVPPAGDPAFLREVMNIVRQERVSVVLPTSGSDIVPYSRNKAAFGSNVVVVSSDGDVVDTCLNKQLLHEKLRGTFDVPFTTVVSEEVHDFPCIAKPIVGKGSRDVFLCKDRGDLEDIERRHHHMLFQEYLPGTEYSIDVLSDLDGVAVAAVARERIEVRAGISYKGTVVRDIAIENECLAIANHLGLKGASCIQMKRDVNGRAKLVEINPRMGGGTILATYAGLNVPSLLIDMACGRELEIGPLELVTMTRYYEEVVLPEEGQLQRS